jgi:hypothetical protein
VVLAYLLSVIFTQPTVTTETEAMSLAALRPVTNLEAKDTPNDPGGSIDLSWFLSPDSARVKRYEVYRATSEDGPFEKIVEFLIPTTSYTDEEVENKKEYYYRVDVVGAFQESASSQISGPVIAKPQWFNTNRLAVLVFAVVYGILVILYIEFAKKDREMFVRRIAGLDAIDEAVGRATEMGKPILFSFGIGYLYDVATIAALSILRRVARRAAQYETRILVPNYDPIVMTAAQETVKQAFSEAGRPDLYQERDITFLTADQFGYAAGVDGIMIREKPGTVFLQGVFYAEALILAETAHSVGAIQIAGTNMATQLPFFIAACDYTLIGEELFAASAYLDRDPQLLGSLKSEDMAKLITVVLIAGAALIGTIGMIAVSITGIQTNFFTRLFELVKSFLTTS